MTRNLILLIILCNFAVTKQLESTTDNNSTFDQTTPWTDSTTTKLACVPTCQATDITHHTIDVLELNCCNDTDYALRFEVISQEHTKVCSCGNHDDQPIGDCQWNLSGLCPNTEYLVQLEASGSSTINCTSETSQALKTKPAAPTKVIGQKLQTINQSAVELEWKEPSCLNGDDVMYEVSHWTGSEIPTNNTTEKTQMIVGNLLPKRTYNFRVIAHNSIYRNLRSESDIQQLRTTAKKPSAPLDLTSEVVNSSTITLTWGPPKEPGGPEIDGYQIVYRLKGNAVNKTANVQSETKRFEITGLEPWKTYLLVIRAYHHQEGQDKLFGEWSDQIEGTTHPAEPSEPLNLGPSNIKSNQVTLTWDEPKVKNGRISGYLVRWTTLTDDVDSKEDTTVDLTYTVQDLLPWKEYNFSVSAFNLLGKKRLLGPEAHISRTTLSSEPSAPTNVTAVAVNSSAIQLQWGRPVQPNGPIDFYQVLCSMNGSALEIITLTPGEDEDQLESYIVPDLEPWIIYTCRIWAVNLNGNETRSGEPREVTIRTRQDKPSTPTNLEVANRTSTEVYLTWEEPEHPHGPLDGYVVSWFSVGNSAIAEYCVVNVTSVTVGTLLPWKEYNLSVSAFNNHYDEEKGRLEGPTITVVTRTRSSEPGSPPEQLKFTSADARSLGVAWMVPAQPNGPIDGFTVSISCTEDNPCSRTDKTKLLAANFSDLQPFQTYIVEVCAYNLDGEDLLKGPCDTISRNTSVAAPSAPIGLMCSAVGANYINVLWYKPEHLNGPLDGYNLEWRKVVDDTLEDWQDRNCTDLQSPAYKDRIDGLHPYTRYEVRVSAFNYLRNDVNSLPLFGESANNSCRTAAAAPTDPKLKIHGVTSNSVELTWESPEKWNGPSEGYDLMWRLKECLSRRAANCDENATSLDSNKDSFVVNDLLPWSNYTFELLAFNHEKNKLKSTKSVQETRTSAGVPAYPETNLTRLQAVNDNIQFLFPKILFHELQGPIVRYAVIVAGLDDTANVSLYQRRHGQGSDNLATWSEAKNYNPMPPYQASPVAWNPYNNAYDPFQCQDHVSEDSIDVIGKKCTIGAELECNTTTLPYCNGPLNSGKYYAVKIRGFTDGGWSETHPLSVYVEPSEEENSSSTGVTVAVSLTVFFLLVGALVGAVFMKKKGLWPQKTTTTTTPCSQENLNTPMTPIPPKRTGTCILISDFSKHVAEMLSDSGLKFSQEFEELKAASPELPSLVANLPGNKPKNRWANILPFDHSRVKLRPISDDQETDYVNASYIPGNTSRREYIASQGPLPSTKDDFWRMIWEQNVSMVVMLTLCVERGKPKCEQYWRDDWEPHYHGDDCIKVVKISESILSAYTIRIFDIQMGGNQRSVKHMHFTKWPDFGCPESPEILINFVRAVRDHLPHSRPAPILVHCSAGVGRTGTFVAVDRLMQQVRDKSEYLDVYRMVLEMRDHRCSMVQTEDQYIYIHECVREIIRDEEERTQTPVPNGFEIYSNLNFNQGE